jgi:hypothetical protein
MNAPRGPSHMRRERQESQRQRSAKEQSPSKRDKKDKKKEKEKETEKDNAKTTLTDFRIVGIEMKELGWSWGLVGEEAMNQVEEEEKVVEEEAKLADNGDVKAEEAGQEELASTEPTTTEEVKRESNDAEVEVATEVKAENEAGGAPTEVKDEPSTEQADAPKEEPSTTEPEDSEGKGKTGGKRKAQSPETGKLVQSLLKLRANKQTKDHQRNDQPTSSLTVKQMKILRPRNLRITKIDLGSTLNHRLKPIGFLKRLEGIHTRGGGERIAPYPLLVGRRKES